MTATITTPSSTGVSPFVFFAEGWSLTTTGPVSDPRKELLYKWTLPSPDGEERIRLGPETAILMEGTSGTVTVQVDVEDGAGTIETATQAVTVQDPDTVYSGTNTICVSTSGTFTGAPTGATQVTSSDFSSVITTYLGPGKRILFRYGETFQANSEVVLNTSTWTSLSQIGSFGKSQEPALIECLATSGTAIINTGSYRMLDGITFYDLKIYQGHTSDKVGPYKYKPFYYAGHEVNNTTFVRVVCGNAWSEAPITFSPDIIEYWKITRNESATKMHERIAFSHCELNTNGNYDAVTMYLAAKWLGILSSKIQHISTSPTSQEMTHTIRTGYHEYMIIDEETKVWHYDNANPPLSGRHALKLHNQMPRGHSPSWQDWAQYASIQCEIIARGIYYPITYGPQDGTVDEYVREGLFERMKVSLYGSVQGMIHLASEDTVVRNNVVITYVNYWDPSAFYVELRGHSPKNNLIAHNTVYVWTNSQINTAYIVYVGSNSGGISVKNNLIWKADSTVSVGEKTGAGSVTLTTNGYSSDPLFSSPTYSIFTLGTGSPAIGAGTHIQQVLTDKDSTTSNRGAPPDQGAYEA